MPNYMSLKSFRRISPRRTKIEGEPGKMPAHSRAYKAPTALARLRHRSSDAFPDQLVFQIAAQLRAPEPVQQDEPDFPRRRFLVDLYQFEITLDAEARALHRQ